MNIGWRRRPKMAKRRTLITSPLAWQMTGDPVAPPMMPVIAERGGAQLKTPRPVLVVDTREQVPLDFSRFAGTLSQIKSPYSHPGGNPNRITQSLIAILAGLQIPFLCSETHELGEEI